MLLLLLAAGLAAAADLAPADVEALTARWPQPTAKLRAVPPAAASLAAAAAFARAQDEPARAQAAGRFEAALEGLGAAKAALLSDVSGLGRIALDVLGGGRLLAQLAAVPEGPQKDRTAGLAAQALYEAGNFAAAADAAKAALKLDPRDRNAFALLKLAEGRGGSALLPQAVDQMGRSPQAAQQGSSPANSVSHIRKAGAPPPPSPGMPALNPNAPDFWDRQLLGPILKQSDSNPVSSKYLSPIVRDGRITLRLARVVDDPGIRGAWGTYNLATAVATLNLDSINRERQEYNAYYATRDPTKAVPAIAHNAPLSQSQIDFIVKRFMPLLVHEAAGHATHGQDLRGILGARAPMELDGELFAWRMEAIYVAAEQRQDPSYLTEPTRWATDEGRLARVWSLSRKSNSQALVSYLRSMGSYSHLVHVGDGSDPKRFVETLNSIQRCRTIYDIQCQTTAMQLVPLLPQRTAAAVRASVQRLNSAPNNAAERTTLFSALFDWATRYYRLDGRSMAKVAGYYAKVNSELDEIEKDVAPVTLWQRARSTMRRR